MRVERDPESVGVRLSPRCGSGTFDPRPRKPPPPYPLRSDPVAVPTEDPRGLVNEDPGPRPDTPSGSVYPSYPSDATLKAEVRVDSGATLVGRLRRLQHLAFVGVGVADET